MKVDYFESGQVKQFTRVTEVDFARRDKGECEIKFEVGKSKVKSISCLLSISW